MADEKVELAKVTKVNDQAVARTDDGAHRPAGSYDYPYGADVSEDLHLRTLWRIVRKRKWLVISVTIVITLLVALQVYRKKSVYQASTLIKIDKENTTVLKIGEATLQADDSDTINTDILIIKSSSLIEDMVAELGLDKNAKLVEPDEKPTWEFIRQLGRNANTESRTPNRVQVRSASDPDPQPSQPRARSRAESERLAPFVRVVQAGLTVDPIQDTRALKISFTHTDPAIAAMVANGVADRFKRYSFENKTDKFTNTSDWLERSTRELQTKVQQSEQELANYSSQHNIFSTEGKENLAGDKLTKLHDQVVRAETDKLLKQSLYEEVNQGRVAQLPDAFVDPRLTELQKKLGELSVTASQLDAEFGPQNPKVIDVREQIAAIQKQITEGLKGLEEKLKSEYQRAVRDADSLNKAFDEAKREAVQQNQAAIQYNILKQDVDTAKSLYNEFLQKTNQTKFQVAEQHNNIQVIESAEVPSGPIGPNRQRAILIALVLSLGAGVGLAFFLEYLDNTVKTTEDVWRYAQLPVLGAIPNISPSSWRPFKRAKRHGLTLSDSSHSPGNGKSQNGSGKLITLDRSSFAAEAYRGLRTSVLLSTAGRPPKNILITSGQSGEGKSTTVLNTARSFVQLGASVLIIDCDMRKPAEHKGFEVDDTRGLSVYLSSDAEVDGLIQKIEEPNLWLLPCGPTPPNPAELISSDRMKDLLADVCTKYDHILIDSPPLMNVVDSLILSTLVDGVILVVNGGKSTRDVLRHSRRELANVGAKIFGVVLNNVNMRSTNDYYYYYRSGDY
jgi:polysaccharide biosynthesis transport protein